MRAKPLACKYGCKGISFIVKIANDCFSARAEWIGRPLWLNRPLRPVEEMFFFKEY
jgi:hypothetical protein